jgi:hypothetical protein
VDDFERRLKRAKTHLNSLDVQVRKFTAGKTYRTERGRDFKRGGYVLQLTNLKPVPPRFGLIASDFIHNLRALLDNLIWATVPASLKGDSRLTFPTCVDSDTFNEFAETVVGRRMPRAFIETLERHQPYNRRPEDVANDRLILLHKMWNADKHHAPFGVMGWALAASAASFGDPPIGPLDFGFRVGPLGKGGEVGWVSARGAKRDIKPRVALDVGFQTRRPTLAVPRHAFFKMYEIVAKEVLPDIRPFLR